MSSYVLTPKKKHTLPQGWKQLSRAERMEWVVAKHDGLHEEICAALPGCEIDRLKRIAMWVIIVPEEVELDLQEALKDVSVTVTEDTEVQLID
jgi:hypothetical protein